MKHAAGAILLAAACASGVDHERLGDAAFAAGDFVVAGQEYRAAVDDRPSPDAWMKLAAVGLRTGEYREAVEGFEQVAALDRGRAEEAARGLTLVAAAAERSADLTGLRRAVEALRALSPGRIKPSQTLSLLRGGDLDPREAAGLGPLALAAAGDAAATDQALLGYGDALRRTTACGEALPVYVALIRRTRDRSLRQRGVDGLGSCGLQLGNDALLLERPDEAVAWFRRVVAVDSTSPNGRKALIGLGDAHVLQGELLAATMAYQDAMRPGRDDSLSAVASARLTRLGPAGDSL